MTPEHAKDILLALVHRFPGLVLSCQPANPDDVACWLEEELDCWDPDLQREAIAGYDDVEADLNAERDSQAL